MSPFARVFAVALFLLPATTFADPYQGVISDGHAHFKGKRAEPDKTIEAMDRNNVDVMVLWVKSRGGWQDRDTLDFAAKYPNRVIPGIAFQHKGWKKQKKSFIKDVRHKAVSGVFKAMGEMSFRGKIGGKLNAPADSPLAREILDIAEKYNLPLTVHHNPFRRLGDKWERTVEYETFIEKTLASNTKAPVIWDHWCGQSTPEGVRKLLKRFPNLTCGLAWLHKPLYWLATPLVDKDSNFLPGWKKVIEDFPRRFIVGVDANSAPRALEDFDSRIRMIRTALGKLAPETAEMVATQNLHRVYRLD